MTDDAPVSVSRRIPASPEMIFAVLADPNRHFGIDGSGMLRGAIDAVQISGLGDVFAMRMHNEQFGDYEMSNTVVEYERDRLIAWEPSRRDQESEPWRYRWRYELVPEEGVTIVTESFDLSRSPEDARHATKDGTVWIAAMTETLERLERLCSTGDAPAGVRILGSLGSADGKGVVRVEDRVDAGADDLWSALTDRRRLAGWLGDVEGDLRLGGELRARFYASGWEGTGRIEVCERSARLLVVTSGVPPPEATGDTGERDQGASTIEVTLAADGDQTVLVWEERGMPVELVAAYGAGIQIHVEDLEDYVAGRARRDAGPRFDQLVGSYEQLAADVGQHHG